MRKMKRNTLHCSFVFKQQNVFPNISCPASTCMFPALLPNLGKHDSVLRTAFTRLSQTEKVDLATTNFCRVYTLIKFRKTSSIFSVIKNRPSFVDTDHTNKIKKSFKNRIDFQDYLLCLQFELFSAEFPTFLKSFLSLE